MRWFTRRGFEGTVTCGGSREGGKELLAETEDQASPKDQAAGFGREGNSEYTTGSW